MNQYTRIMDIRVPSLPTGEGRAVEEDALVLIE